VGSNFFKNQPWSGFFRIFEKKLEDLPLQEKSISFYWFPVSSAFEGFGLGSCLDLGFLVFSRFWIFLVFPSGFWCWSSLGLDLGFWFFRWIWFLVFFRFWDLIY
jgi:hypothetical protein